MIGATILIKHGFQHYNVRKRLYFNTNGNNKENSVFRDGIGVKGLRFKLHGNNHGKHYGNLYGNYLDNHGNHGLWTLVD